MKIVLGPCPCRKCGLLVVYDGLSWRIAKGPGRGRTHLDCKAETRRAA
jgi:hypothetical protein